MQEHEGIRILEDAIAYVTFQRPFETASHRAASRVVLKRKARQIVHELDSLTIGRNHDAFLADVEREAIKLNRW